MDVFEANIVVLAWVAAGIETTFFHSTPWQS
jgi:hypothetical protein